MRQRLSDVCVHGALLTEGCEDCWIVPFANTDTDKAKAARKDRKNDMETGWYEALLYPLRHRR